MPAPCAASPAPPGLQHIDLTASTLRSLPHDLSRATGLRTLVLDYCAQLALTQHDVETALVLPSLRLLRLLSTATPQKLRKELRSRAPAHLTVVADMAQVFGRCGCQLGCMGASAQWTANACVRLAPRLRRRSAK